MKLEETFTAVWRMLTGFIKKAWGFTFLGMALIGVGVEVDHYRNGTQSNTAVGVVLIGLLASAGVALLRSAYRRPALQRSDERLTQASARVERLLSAREADAQAIVQVAAERHGSLTITDVASELGLSFNEARSRLDALAKQGECDAETHDGMVIYRFVSSKR